jgi:hypothetical protein
VVPLVRNCPYLRVAYVDLHMQQSVFIINFLHIRSSSCVRVSLPVLEFRESVTSGKILCKFEDIRRYCVFVLGCVDCFNEKLGVWNIIVTRGKASLEIFFPRPRAAVLVK